MTQKKLCWVVPISTIILILPLVAQSTALEVIPHSQRPGQFEVRRGNGKRVVFSVTMREPANLDQHQISGDCRWSDWPRHEGFELVVAREPVSSPRHIALVPLSHPMVVVDLLAVERKESVVVGIALEYGCTPRYGDLAVKAWATVEIWPRVRVLRNSRLIEGGRGCSQRDVARARPRIEPSLGIHHGDLWFTVPLSSEVCWNGGEQRGWFEWAVGQPPAPNPLPAMGRVADLATRFEELGFHPYQVSPLAEGLTGLWGEVPQNHGAPRILGVESSTGAKGLLILPRYGFEWGHRWIVDNDGVQPGLDQTRRITDIDRGEWPEISVAGAFHWSEQFLAARKQQRSRILVGDERVKIFELEFPCIEHFHPVPTDSTTERWLLRTEVEGGEVQMQAALLEACAKGVFLFGDRSAIGFPVSRTETVKRSVQVDYGPPRFDAEGMEADKFLFDRLRNIRKVFAIERVVFDLDSPMKTEMRPAPQVPAAGQGWTHLLFESCEFQIRHTVSGQYPRGGDRTHIEPKMTSEPMSFAVCESAETSLSPCSFEGRIDEHGAVSDLRIGSCDREMPDEMKLQLQSFIESWRFAPAKTESDEATPAFLSVEVIPVSHQGATR